MPGTGETKEEEVAAATTEIASQQPVRQPTSQQPAEQPASQQPASQPLRFYKHFGIEFNLWRELLLGKYGNER